MEWFRVDSAMPVHYKTKMLATRLNCSTLLAAGVVTSLWAFVARSREDGRLAAMDAASLAIAIDWQGDPDLLMDALIEAGFIDRTDLGYAVHDWERHQPLLKKRQSMSNSRSQHHSGPHGTTVDHSEPHGTSVHHCGKPQDKTRQDKTEKKGKNKSSGRPMAVPPRLLESWSRHCAHLPQPKVWTPKRQKYWRMRIREEGFLENLDEICRRVGRSPFLSGRNDRGWRATIDWLLERRDAWAKVMEGAYDQADEQEAGREPAESASAKLKRLEDQKRSMELMGITVGLEELEREITNLRGMINE